MKRAKFYFSDMNPVADGIMYSVWFLNSDLWAENLYLWGVIFGDVT